MLQSSSPESLLLYHQSHQPRRSSGSFPVTPVKNEAGAKQAATLTSSDMSTPTSTIRERRGRCQIRDGSFHPLSILTKSVLYPFALDTDKALEILKGDSPDRVEEAQNALCPERQDDRATGKEAVKPPPSTPVSAGPSSASHVNTMGVIPAYANSDIDLITALRTTSPEKDSPPKIHADFAILCQLPVPEPSQHPVYSAIPFELKTEPPLLSTSTSIDEIRWFNYKTRRDSQTKLGRGAVERKRSFFGLELRTPSSVRSRNAFANPEESSLNITIPTPSTANTNGSTKSSSPLATELVTPKESASAVSTNSSVRKFSDLFRRKESLEKSLDTPALSPRSSPDTPNLDRHDLEKYLRRTTNTPTYGYDPYSPYPRHPNTGRGWKSRNLKCTACNETPCAVCHRVCCAFKAAVLALETHKEGSPGRPMALRRIQEITKVFPYGREAPTFLMCTPRPTGFEGDAAGCGKSVCPDCCSICPDDCCADTLCRKCKPAMWEECDWHKGGMAMLTY